MLTERQIPNFPSLYPPRGRATGSFLSSKLQAPYCRLQKSSPKSRFRISLQFSTPFFFRPQILALSPLKESQQRRNQDHSKALALKIEIDMPYALFEPREVYPREKSIFVHVSLTGSCHWVPTHLLCSSGHGQEYYASSKITPSIELL